jgi:putative ABC transport system permease protein
VPAPLPGGTGTGFGSPGFTVPSLFQDLSHAIRGLRKRPGFWLAAVVTLAVGIGANVAVFSLVNALLLRPLPFGERSDRVVMLHSTHPQQPEDWDDSGLSYLDYADIRDQSTSLEGIGAFLTRNFTVSTDADADRLLGVSVTPDLFSTLGVEPMVGRTFTPDDAAAPGLESVVILSHGLWQRRFGADPSIVGEGVVINERTRTVVGIMPAGFKFPERSELFMPLRWDEAPRAARSLAVVAVLERGTTIDQAQADVSAIARRLAETHPATNRDFGVRLLSFRDSNVGSDDRRVSTTLMAAVTFVLLIACANLANLLLVRGAARQREMAIRSAMGASRSRLIAVVLSESAVLALVGTVIGTLAAAWAIDWMRASWPEEIPYWVQLDLDGRIVAFTVATTVLTTLAIGLLPAIRASRPRVVEDLKEGSRSVSLGRAGQRAQTGLAVAQIALCLALLVGANLMIRSFLSLQRASIGFDDAPVLTLRAYLAGDVFDDNRARANFFARAVEAVAAIPGVTGAAATTSIPGDDGGAGVRIVTDERLALGDELGAQTISATGDVFGAIGLRIVAGRTFTTAEAVDPEARVTVINERLSRQLWPDGSAVGRRIGIREGRDVSWFRIVGIAPDVVYEELGEQSEQSQRNLYLPYALSAPRTMAILVRSTADPDTLRGPVRDALRQLHGGLPVYDIRTMTEVRRFTTFEQRFFGQLMGAFAGTALLLACLGVYALLAYATRLRTREIGVRLSLGARPRDVAGLFVRQAVQIGSAGLAIGLGLATAVAQTLSGTLFAVDAFDPWLFLTAGTVLLAVVLAAAYLPARQAARVDPMLALRNE